MTTINPVPITQTQAPAFRGKNTENILFSGPIKLPKKAEAEMEKARELALKQFKCVSEAGFKAQLLRKAMTTNPAIDKEIVIKECTSKSFMEFVKKSLQKFLDKISKMKP